MFFQKNKNFAGSLVAALLLTAVASVLSAQATLCSQHQNEVYQIITSGTPQSNGLTSGQTGVKILLEGDLTINQDFVMDGWVIKANIGKSIIVNPSITLTINNSDLFACADGLWKGIWLKTNASIAISECKVEDAEQAIYSVASVGHISALSNHFNRNKFGIHWDNATSSYAGMHFLVFSNNTFDCTSARNDGPSTSQSGVWLKKGLGTLPNGIYNSFVKQDNGIYMDNCFFDINACRFESCRYGIYLQNGSINQKGLGMLASLTTYKDCFYGVYGLNSALNILDNFFKDSRAKAIWSDGMARFKTIVEKNKIETDFALSPDDISAGVHLSHTSIYQDLIKGNQFTVDAPVYCVIVQGGTYSNHKNLDIIDNVFNVTYVGEITELQLAGSGCAVSLINNRTDGTSGTQSPLGAYHMHNFAGYKTHYCELNSVYVPHNAAFPHSFLVFDSSIKFCENISDGSQNGFSFNGDKCGGTDLGTSHIGKHSTGLYVSSKIGPQDLRGNCWLNASNYSQFAVKCNGNPIASKFKVDGSILCRFPQGSISPPALFDPTGNGEIGCLPHSPGVKGNEMNEWELKIANGEIFQLLTNPVEIWNAQRYLFQKLYLHPELRPNGSLGAAFFQQHLTSLVGQYSTAERLWSETGLPNSVLEQQNTTASNVLWLALKEMAQLDSLINLFPLNGNLQTLKISKATETIEYLNAHQLLTSQLNSARLQSINDVIAQMEALSVETVFQWNEKRIRILTLLRSIDARSFTEVELAEIRAIAAQCPELGGISVSVARTLLPQIEQVLYESLPYDTGCGQLRPNHSDERDNPIEIRPNQYNIFPNPASDLLNVELQQPSNGRMYLIDGLGRVVVSQETTESNAYYNLNLAQLPIGAYFLLSVSESQEVSRTQILIWR